MTFVDRYVADSPLRLSDAGIAQDLAVPLDGVTRAEHEAADAATRVDLVFYGVRHSRDSYEGRIYFNNPEADHATPRDRAHGYAGSFWVFAHGRCAGGEGHCNPDWGDAEDALDYRRAHHMEPYTVAVNVTAAMQDVAGDELTLTVVAVGAEDADAERPPMQFDHIRMLTFG